MRLGVIIEWDIEFDKVWLYCADCFIEEGRIRLAIVVGKVVVIEGWGENYKRV